MTFPAGDVEVWLVDLVACAEALNACEADIPRLSPEEESRTSVGRDSSYDSFRRPAYIARRLILERAFGPSLRRLPLPRDALGRPLLPPSYVGAYSLSHTRMHALVAVTRLARVGVDIEGPRPVRMTEGRRIQIETAAAVLSDELLPSAGGGASRFLQAWVRLEALAKADGRGIGHILTSIGAVGQPRGAEIASMAAGAKRISEELRLYVHDLDAGSGKYAAVAAPLSSKLVLRSLPASQVDLRAIVT